MKEQKKINLEHLKETKGASLGKPFDVSENYFNDFNWDKIKTSKEIDTAKISGKLNEPPLNYFNEVNENIFKKVPNKSKIIIWRKLAVAASLLIVVSSLIYYSVKNKASQEFSDVAFRQFSSSQLSAFIATDSTTATNDTYRTQANFDLNQSFQTVSNEELTDFLTETADKNDNF